MDFNRLPGMPYSWVPSPDHMQPNSGHMAADQGHMPHGAHILPSSVPPMPPGSYLSGHMGQHMPSGVMGGGGGMMMPGQFENRQIEPMDCEMTEDFRPDELERPSLKFENVHLDKEKSIKNVSHDTEKTSSTVSDQVISSVLPCDACNVSTDSQKVKQCCHRHRVCNICVEKQVKQIMSTDSQETQILCPVPACPTYIPKSEARKILPSFIMDLLDEKLNKKAMESIIKMEDIHCCPFCGFPVAIDHNLKKFVCPNDQCKQKSCRYCKKHWSAVDHAQCTAFLNLLSESGEELHPPKNWIPVRKHCQEEAAEAQRKGALIMKRKRPKEIFGSSFLPSGKIGARKSYTEERLSPSKRPAVGDKHRPSGINKRRRNEIEDKLQTMAGTSDVSQEKQRYLDRAEGTYWHSSPIPSGITAKSSPVKVDKEVISSMLLCDACDVCIESEKVIQCCHRHLVCHICVEGQVKQSVSSDSKETEILCPMPACPTYIAKSEARKIVPKYIIDLLDEKLNEKAMQSIVKMEDIYCCPFCDLPVAVDHDLKKFVCPNDQCKKKSCRYCKKPWSAVDHAQCTAFLNLLSELHPPKNWIPMRKHCQDFITVKLDENGQEFLDIRKLFRKTMHSVKLLSIRRIQNPHLWQKFSLTRKHMKEDIGSHKLNEEQLFHGTAWKAIKCICRDGLDWRMCGVNGKLFGKGTYFAKAADYSDKYSKPVSSASNLTNPGSDLQNPGSRQCFQGPCHSSNKRASIPDETSNINQILQPNCKYMFVARVLVGRYTLGLPSYRKPPIDENDAEGRTFNSCVNKVHSPSIFVIFDSTQCYPEYLIEYKN